MRRIYLFILMALMILLSRVSGLTIDSVSSNPKEIGQGQIADIEILLRNDLDQTLEDITITLDLTGIPFAPYESSNEIFVEKIKKDRTEAIEFKLIALSGADSGIYRLPIKMRYNKEDESKIEKTELVSLVIKSQPILSVEGENVLIKNQKNELVIKVINKGMEDVKFLEIELGNSGHFSLLSQKNLYLGNLDSDDFESAIFSIFIKENAQNLVNIPIHLRYRDSSNKEYSETQNLELRFYDREEALKLGLIKRSNVPVIIGVIISLILAYIIYRIIRGRIRVRRQKKK